MSGSWTVGRYLITRLEQVGVRHVFGVPGDYVLGLMDEIVDSEIELVGTCNELNAGYAADAYGRVNGIGAACVTYAVGGFSILNAVAGAFAERVPVVVLCGGPNRSDRDQHRLLHHTLGDYGVQVDVFAHVTQRSVGLSSGEAAPDEIDDAITACVRHRRPVFIEVPADLVTEECRPPEPIDFDLLPPSDPDVLAEAVSEAAEMLGRAESCVVLGGVEVHRFGLGEQLEGLLDHLGWPMATALMGKSVIRETHPNYIGVYSGALSEEGVRRTVEEADAVLSIGAWMSDINLGIYTAQIDVGRLIHATADRVQIKRHYFDNVYLGDFIAGLRDALPDGSSRGPRIQPAASSLFESFEPVSAAEITIERFYQRINHFLDEHHVVLADAGDSFLCAGDLIMHEGVGFICQAFYCSIGFTIPGALGVGLADRSRRPVVFVGDGAFQMTAQELSTLIRFGVAPVIFLMNNRGYTVERVIHDGPYNDIQNWRYHELVRVFGGGFACEVRSEGDLEIALAGVRKHPDELSFIEVHLDPDDCSAALKRLGAALAKQRFS
ncbi:MAG: alpha-keto acid decarboxylase family protein [Deltaproteobacteria bacterium]|nr:alpha-keto acid decarboxylase family protein [Deltaproteobacteria bacterium]MBW2399205.1 alpha-keto acid decarboxylase family protein [Deltaproteobacteria bacterium]MBW2665010.1 alpha-keto acid decarboxylase family protein [Deltaproteobacteria bacterium]